jgi:uncharacterized protein YdeI (YjbR/CyaY-like superfamily)
MKLPNLIEAKSAAEWRRWLKKNHLATEFVWLGIYKKSSGIKTITYDEAVDEALCFGWIDGLKKGFDELKFIQRFSPRKKKSIWSKVNKEKAMKLIKAGKMTPAGIIAIKEAKKNGAWERAYSLKKRLNTPPDLEKALKSKKKAWENFQGFTASQRSRYIFWINFVKRVETRKKRIKQTVEFSLQNKKPWY